MTMAPSKEANQNWIERVEQARDLRTALGGLDAGDEKEIQFTEWSPGRVYVTIWSMESGEEISVPRYQAVAALNQRGPGGNYRWTTKKELAPTPKVRSVKCFLHPESAERAFLDEIGIAVTCLNDHLASEPSKWTHARNRHPTAYAAYQDETNRREKASTMEQQRQQTEAMLSLAGSARGESLACAVCGQEAKSLAGLKAHERSHAGRE